MPARIMITSLVAAVLWGLGLCSAETEPARPWGFSKDTVTEWDGGNLTGVLRYDTLYLANNSDDTLKFDSATLEIVQPLGVFEDAFIGFLVLDSWNTGGWNNVDVHGSDFRGEPNSNHHISLLRVLPYTAAPFGTILRAKIQSIPNYNQYGSDSLIVRVVFYSGMESDTVFIRGMHLGEACCLVGLQPRTHAKKSALNKVQIGWDLNGRVASPRRFSSQLPLR